MTPKTNTKIIRDTRGFRLRITPTRLVQIEHISNRPWYVTAEAIRQAYRNLDAEDYATIQIHEVGTRQNVFASFRVLSNGGGMIGCCIFDTPIFKEILRRFGVRKSRARAAKAGK